MCTPLSWPAVLGWQKHQTQSLATLSKIQEARRNEALLDGAFRIRTSERLFPFHKVLVAAASPVMERTLMGLDQEEQKLVKDGSSPDRCCCVVTVTSPGIDEGSLALALDWIYYGRVEVPSTDALIGLLRTAEFLGIAPLARECLETLEQAKQGGPGGGRTVLLVFETNIFYPGFSLRFYNSERDNWRSFKTPNLNIKGQFLSPVISIPRTNQVVFLVQQLSSSALCTKVFRLDLNNFRLKELSTLDETTGNHKLVYCEGGVKLVTYFPFTVIRHYNEERNQWEKTPVGNESHVSRVGSCVMSAGGRLFIIGGKFLEVGADFCDTIDVFNSATGRFEVAGRMSVGRAGASCVELGGKIVIAGGYTDTTSPDLSLVEEFDPVTGRLRKLAPMLGRRSDFYLAPCEDGVLVVDDWSTRKDNVEYYDPFENRWSFRRCLDLSAKHVVGVVAVAANLLSS